MLSLLLPPARPRAAVSPDVTASAPRRPAVILPGLGNNTADYARLAAALRDDHGVPAVAVARVSRPDWLRNAAGLVDPSYWRCNLRPRPVLDWYLKRVDEAVSEARELSPSMSPTGLLLDALVIYCLLISAPRTDALMNCFYSIKLPWPMRRSIIVGFTI
jgi:hypothetical protein